MLLGCCGLLPSAALLGRRSRWTLGVLSLLAPLTLLSARPAQAQAVNVSNLSKNTSESVGIIGQGLRIANAFTTGGTTADYFQIDSVVLNLSSSGTQAGALEVSIYTNSSGSPGSKIGSNLTGTIDSTPGQTTYSTSQSNQIFPRGGTTYFVHITKTTTGLRRIKTTTSNDEDSSSSTGLSIADTARQVTSTWHDWAGGLINHSFRFKVNATKTTLSAPTGYITSGNASSVYYGGTSLGNAGSNTSFSPAYSSGSLLRVEYTAISPGFRLVCAAGTLEFGWYWRHWLQGRLGTAQVTSQGQIRYYQADYTPTSGNGAEYLFLAYCTLDLGLGGGKIYSTPVDLLGRKAKEEAPFSQATRVTVSYSSFTSFSNFTAKNTTRATCDPSSRDLYDARYNPSYAHCLEWDGFSGNYIRSWTGPCLRAISDLVFFFRFSCQASCTVVFLVLLYG